MTDMKQCSRCKQEFPATREYFVARSSSKDGLDSWCKECKRKNAKQKYDENPEHGREIARRWREKHPERSKQIQRDWRKNNPEGMKAAKKRHRVKNRDRIREQDKERHRKIMQDPVKHAKKRESDRRYREKNIEKDRQHSRDYRKNNPGIVKASIQRWYQENPERAVLLKQRRFARKLGLPDTLTIEEWNYTLAYWNRSCVYCGETSEEITLDHYIPLNHEHCPGTVAENCLPACRSCNSSKNDGDVIYWMNWRFGEEHTKVVIEAIEAYFVLLRKE